MKKVAAFGELMLRLNPDGYLRLTQASDLHMSFAGGEANAAVSISNFGTDTVFVTKLPDNDLGKMAVRELRKYGVNGDHIAWGGPRIGIYFVEKGASQRPSRVLYDRGGSSIALARREDFRWEEILEDCGWFHFTGITPALGGECPDICRDALRECKRRGITVSCDLNYRGKLWSRKEAGEVMEGLMEYVDVCIANESDAADVFGISAENSDIVTGELNREGYISVARQLQERFSLKAAAITLRKSFSASVNGWSAMIYTGQEAYFSPEYRVQLVDRVGGGDSFAGALIYAMNSGYGPQHAIDFAAAASCLKQTQEYDFNQATLEEVNSLMKGNASGRVQR
ncbi:MAG TPA: sugar kinase [Candidatus Limivivens intestinipullorum]|uniref:Sugar kinase n=1 Tax=Candidatus Limivivens intestinipullorum TaxID=2840858 RepID=A0A9D1ER80_9FIRM|nr:sugar kinase [Candidatus Limivivens intestinipullorum]